MKFKGKRIAYQDFLNTFSDPMQTAKERFAAESVRLGSIQEAERLINIDIQPIGLLFIIRFSTKDEYSRKRKAPQKESG